MKIPRRFKLFGQTIEVEFKDDLANKDNAFGCAEYRYNKILLQRATEAIPKLPSQLEEVFCHELCHWLFYMIGDYEIEGHSLKEDEVLIRLLGNALHQALTTMEVEE